MRVVSVYPGQELCCSAGELWSVIGNERKDELDLGAAEWALEAIHISFQRHSLTETLNLSVVEKEHRG